MSQSDDEEDEEHCPLCCETLDITDRNFFPCPCEYQVWWRGGEREGGSVVCRVEPLPVATTLLSSNRSNVHNA